MRRNPTTRRREINGILAMRLVEDMARIFFGEIT